MASNPGGLNAFRERSKAAKPLGQVSWLQELVRYAKRNARVSSQWRDRAGVSPASLFSPTCGAPGCLKSKEQSDRSGHYHAIISGVKQTLLDEMR